ncbi:MAG: ornithine carbamoyltransferase [Chloroflexi bacterium]|jgi:ornithine carbamoyltransferase|nr:ornithine carbamoyltransferase [Chloroflexota bacterium]MBT4003963.1 ornithine carbamoyltransferase [Chloroflexota bacterium]MBT4305731.1 ornithine carbamoyltransferase [Chloroflexota bacterium]MBT4533555.1 ornithine carbamoyltransferase [Chloroflexota bacterium]MBT4681802.1 ornithine carbamoyltransferase [Chloroflexota bacterium]
MQDFLAIADFTPKELQEMLDLAVELKKERAEKGANRPLLKDKKLAMIFQKPSLRTRVSFERGMEHMGGSAMYIGPAEVGLGKRESIADVARVVAGYVDMVMARVFEHDHVLKLAKWSNVPVVNGLSDYNHPCQAMADALTIYEEFGTLKDINITYVGDGNNVAVSLMHICAKLGANFTIGNPEGYDMPASTVEEGQIYAKESGSTITLLNDAQDAVKNADVIYTDTWTSMGQEEETKKREAVFPPFQVNDALVSAANDRVIVLHCLPAHRNHEITDSVADGPHSRLFPQAHNRMHAQKAVLVKMME